MGANSHHYHFLHVLRLKGRRISSHVSRQVRLFRYFAKKVWEIRWSDRPLLSREGKSNLVKHIYHTLATTLSVCVIYVKLNQVHDCIIHKKWVNDFLTCCRLIEDFSRYIIRSMDIIKKMMNLIWPRISPPTSGGCKMTTESSMIELLGKERNLLLWAFSTKSICIFSHW